MLKLRTNFLSLSKRIICLKFTPMRMFRDYRDSDIHHRSNELNPETPRKTPYEPQFELSEEERIENEKLPVEERILDWRKYMKHKGKLKYSTGMFLVDVEPFPRLKMMMLCDIAMNIIKKYPDSFEYKHMSYNFIKYIMRVVDENESIIDIESKISDISTAEEIIMMLHNEVTLLQNLLHERSWELIESERKSMDLKEMFFATAAFRDYGNAGLGATESAAHRKNERPERPATANFSEKTKESPKH